jgi:hypothetical protein
MKHHLLFTAVALIATTLHAAAQGNLTPPPGAPAPVMKSLDQIEARTPISLAPYTINAPGSYYLTSNLSVSAGNAITIAAKGVTLDLNGFTISSTASPAAGAGILINALMMNITILNGHIQGNITNNGNNIYSGSGFQDGIDANDTTSLNISVSGISVSGCMRHGINLGWAMTSASAKHCMVRTVGGFGIRGGIIESSIVTDCGGIGIAGDIISHCRADSSGEAAIMAITSVTYSYGSCINSGIECSLGPVSYSVGGGGFVAISAPIVVACRATYGTIASFQKHLGTP